MCGIAGKIDFAGPVEPNLIHRMCAVMEHRGPDSRGVFVQNGIGLGMQRLAIIDLAGGDQPIFNEDQTIALVMNEDTSGPRIAAATLGVHIQSAPPRRVADVAHECHTSPAAGE